MNKDTIVRFPASGRTIIIVTGEVKFIGIFAGDYPQVSVVLSYIQAGPDYPLCRLYHGRGLPAARGPPRCVEKRSSTFWEKKSAPREKKVVISGICKSRCSRSVRKNFYTERVINV